MNTDFRSRFRCFVCILIVALVFTWLPDTLGAQQKTGKQKQTVSASQPPSTSAEGSRTGSNKPPAAKNIAFAMTKPMKAELQLFVRENHAELEKLLNWLEEHRPEQYEKAVRSLYKTQNRLKTLRDRDPEKYQISLAHWKVKSRIQLTAANLAIVTSAELREELKRLVEREIQLRTQQLKMEADRISQRRDRINAQIDRLEKNQDKEVQRQMDLALKATKRLGPAKKLADNASRKPPKRSKDSVNNTKKKQSPANDR